MKWRDISYGRFITFQGDFLKSEASFVPEKKHGGPDMTRTLLYANLKCMIEDNREAHSLICGCKHG